MKDEIRKALQDESLDYRSRAAALIAHADRIDNLLCNDPLTGFQFQPISAAPKPTSISRIHSPRKNGRVTQTEAAKRALEIIGKPATLAEIVQAIKVNAIQAKIGNLNSLRSVLSKSEDVETNGSGQWRLRTELALETLNGYHAQTDLAVGQQNREGGG